jgi:hypothetical protein
MKKNINSKNKDKIKFYDFNSKNYFNKNLNNKFNFDNSINKSLYF